MDDPITQQVRAEVQAQKEALPSPAATAEAADALWDAMVPPQPYELDYLAGRICISLEECQLAMGIGERTMKTALRDGSIPTVKIGGRRLVPVRALERHLEAMAYAESGCLDAWENAMVRGSTRRLREARRRAGERRRFLKRKLRDSRAAIQAGSQLSQAHLTALQADLATLAREQAVTERFAHDFQAELEAAERKLGDES